MANVNLSIPADLMRAARSKLGGRGQAPVKQYLLSSLQSLADSGKEPLSSEQIRALVAGVQSPSIAVSEKYWTEKIRRYKKRHSARRPTRRSA
jgi:hypothetical protein